MKSSLLQSRKFKIMIVDVVVSLITYFVTKYASPETAKDVLFLIGALQPVILAVIGFIGVQNVEYIKQAGTIKRETIWANIEDKTDKIEETPQ